MNTYPSKHRAFPRAALVVLLASVLAAPLSPRPAGAQGTELAEAIVLVNSHSARFDDWAHYIRPYFNHFGFPYTELDVGTAPLPANIGSYALIVVGHRELDLAGTDLDNAEEDRIFDAVMSGSGLLNFDGDLADAGVGHYGFVDQVFGFSYQPPHVDYGVSFPIVDGTLGRTIDCTADANQDPVLATNPAATWITDIDVTDNAWTEMRLSPRPVPALMAGIDENLPVMHCFETGLPSGEYQVFANLYTGAFGEDLTYHYGYSQANPAQFAVDTWGRSGGEDQFGEYLLGTVAIPGDRFDIYFQDADARPVAQAADPALLPSMAAEGIDAAAPPAYFGWSSIRLLPVGSPAPTMHWITERHDPGEWIGTGSLEMAGIATMPPATRVVALSHSEPLLLVAEAGQGRAVQWASYDWMSHTIKGPIYGLDDLVWRGAVWAARKPFVMQGLPPFVTMRVDDALGPFDWITTANTYNFKPWLGLFYERVSETSAPQLSGLVNAGMATAAVHAKNEDVTGTGVFYYQHGVGNLDDATVQDNFDQATSWFNTRSIPISRFVIPQFYELGTNVFDHLQGWGVEFAGVSIEPGTGYGSSWIDGGPFRLHETGASDSGNPLYYSDWITVTGRPDLDRQLFNCLTEIRDDTGNEWRPSSDRLGSVGRGTRQLKRALDAMALSTLFTHEAYLHAVAPADLAAILQGIETNLASYGVQGVTMDYACQYARAMHTSRIDAAVHDVDRGMLTVTLAGNTDVQTAFYLFTGVPGAIQQEMIAVPQFNGSVPVEVHLGPGQTFYIYLPLITRQHVP